jgi:hypothetical protein
VAQPLEGVEAGCEVAVWCDVVGSFIGADVACLKLKPH